MDVLKVISSEVRKSKRLHDDVIKNTRNKLSRRTVVLNHEESHTTKKEVPATCRFNLKKIQLSARKVQTTLDDV